MKSNFLYTALLIVLCSLSPACDSEEEQPLEEPSQGDVCTPDEFRTKCWGNTFYECIDNYVRLLTCANGYHCVASKDLKLAACFDDNPMNNCTEIGSIKYECTNGIAKTWTCTQMTDNSKLWMLDYEKCPLGCDDNTQKCRVNENNPGYIPKEGDDCDVDFGYYCVVENNREYYLYCDDGIVQASWCFGKEKCLLSKDYSNAVCFDDEDK